MVKFIKCNSPLVKSWYVVSEKSSCGKYIHIMKSDYSDDPKSYYVILNDDQGTVSPSEREGTRFLFEKARHAKSFAAKMVNEYADYYQHNKECIEDDERRYYAKRPDYLENLKSHGLEPSFMRNK